MSKKCRKVAFKTKEQARDALRVCKAKGTGERRFYPCPYCPGMYHLTSEDKPTK